MKKNKKETGAEKFHAYYSEVYGERWQDLIKVMEQDPRHIALVNPYSDYKVESPEWLPFAHEMTEPWPKPGEGPLCPYYFMDGASYLAPFSLAPQAGEKVLDLCAAPGGKSLVLAYLMEAKGFLTSNDKSTDRRFRLQRVLRQYLPQDFLDEGVKVTGFDASAWCLYEQEAYDKILLDAPCSSERHVLKSEKHLQEWNVKRTKRLAALQWKMLASSWLVLKPGGRIVYSTCSLSPLENDHVVEKLVKKYPQAQVTYPDDEKGERTQFGTIYLPDTSGFGPFYLAILEKPAL